MYSDFFRLQKIVKICITWPYSASFSIIIRPIFINLKCVCWNVCVVFLSALVSFFAICPFKSECMYSTLPQFGLKSMYSQHVGQNQLSNDQCKYSHRSLPPFPPPYLGLLFRWPSFLPPSILAGWGWGVGLFGPSPVHFLVIMWAGVWDMGWSPGMTNDEYFHVLHLTSHNFILNLSSELGTDHKKITQQIDKVSSCPWIFYQWIDNVGYSAEFLNDDSTMLIRTPIIINIT